LHALVPSGSSAAKLLDSISININTPLPPTFPDDSFPTTQDSFIVTGGASQDDDNIAGVGDDNESIVCQSQLLTDDVVMAQSCSTIT
jgi:hypothetical protein